MMIDCRGQMNRDEPGIENYLTRPEAGNVGAQAAQIAASAISIDAESQQRGRVAHHLMS
jgi:hypothetical protein